MSNNLPYKSPQHKLVKFFERSRDQWKTKCAAAKKQIKYLNGRLKYHQARTQYWKARAKALEKEITDLKAAHKKPVSRPTANEDQAEDQVRKGDIECFTQTVAGHHDSIDHVQLFLLLVLDAASSLRGASRALAIVLSFFGVSTYGPTWYAGRFWLMRLGDYQLMRPKEQAKDWV